MLAFVSCNSGNEGDSLNKENEAIEKEVQLSENNTKEEASVEEEQKLEAIEFKPVEEFLPPLYKIAEQKNPIIGNLNNDAFQDAVVFVENVDTDDTPDFNILILLGTEKGEYEHSSMSGDLRSMFVENQTGMADVKLKNRVITSYHQVAMRAHVELKFRYELKKGKVMLIGSEEEYYGNAAGDDKEKVSSNYLTNTRIVKFEKEKEKVIKLNSSLTPLEKLNDETISQILK